MLRALTLQTQSTLLTPGFRAEATAKMFRMTALVVDAALAADPRMLALALPTHWLLPGDDAAGAALAMADALISGSSAAAAGGAGAGPERIDDAGVQQHSIAARRLLEIADPALVAASTLGTGLPAAAARFGLELVDAAGGSVAGLAALGASGGERLLACCGHVDGSGGSLAETLHALFAAEGMP
jgi:hypothetical protein